MPDPQTKWLKTKLFDWMYSKLTNEKFDLGEIINKNKLKNYLIEFKKMTKYRIQIFYGNYLI